MTETKGDVQHHIGYAYHKLNDRRLMWIEYLEEKIEACQQRIQDSGKRVAREESSAPQEETEALEPVTTATEVEPEREDETDTTDLDTREEAIEAGGEGSKEEAGLW